MEHTLLKASCILEVKNKNKIFEKKRKKFLTNPIYDPSTEVQQDYLLAYNNPMLFVFNIHHNQYLICMALDIVNKMHKNYFKILKKAITYFYKLRYFFEKRIFS